MTRQELTQKLHELRGTVSKLDSSLRLLEKSDPSCFPSFAEDAALRAESLACRLCDVYNTAHLGPRTCTRISVMEREQFPVWIASLKPDLGISDFDPEPA